MKGPGHIWETGVIDNDDNDGGGDWVMVMIDNDGGGGHCDQDNGDDDGDGDGVRRKLDDFTCTRCQWQTIIINNNNKQPQKIR